MKGGLEICSTERENLLSRVGCERSNHRDLSETDEDHGAHPMVDCAGASICSAHVSSDRGPSAVQRPQYAFAFGHSMDCKSSRSQIPLMENI
jgi:hypothetical protein